MRPQSVKQQTISYTRLEEQGLVRMIDRSEDVLKMLEERAFISIEGKFMSIYSVFLEKLEACKMEYQLKWFANGDLHSSPHTEINLPHFIDDRVLLPDGRRGERQIRPPHSRYKRYEYEPYSIAVLQNPFLHTDERTALYQVLLTCGFIAYKGRVPVTLLQFLSRHKCEFSMRSCHDEHGWEYEIQLHGFIDDRDG